jgi:hypothetical protein
MVLWYCLLLHIVVLISLRFVWLTDLPFTARGAATQLLNQSFLTVNLLV